MAEQPIVHQGEAARIAFVCTDNEGRVIDLSGGTLTAEVSWRNRVRLTLEVEAGEDAIEILTLKPAQANFGDEQLPHGVLKLSATTTRTIPAGRVAQVRRWFVDALGNRMAAGLEWLTVVTTPAEEEED